MLKESPSYGNFIAGEKIGLDPVKMDKRFLRFA